MSAVFLYIRYIMLLPRCSLNRRTIAGDGTRLISLLFLPRPIECAYDMLKHEIGQDSKTCRPSDLYKDGFVLCMKRHQLRPRTPDVCLVCDNVLDFGGELMLE